MAYWVYVLQSEKAHRRYVGHTDNLAARLTRHNLGLVFSTAPYRPWRLVYSEKLETRSDAMKQERFLKSGQGREFIREILSRQSPPAEGGINPPTPSLRRTSH
jgi:putative endonuclease